uniref:DNA-directed RNA polymerase subunit beta'' n=1 Tax=Trieres chinensis TaxID=1514140 RepID=RPOC2_TRICV|nr:RNA polymerase beta'' subunit [Trieres chinensis]P49468.1 RecName: Full=DNA-directed RNA polymerase subunit beta''; AltName: Full=PEP; AltName: Full=Plastid-encoded RNA polymerase subunit beta''; Short=RNA polymerase subunit beta'' [Trieres chinensis]CAA91746.1 RNA polymerase beta''-chain [Trieres chinensis]
MKTYTYQNTLISKKQLKQLLSWSFTTYDSMQACSLADELKYLGFKYASKAGISISIEDLKVPYNKNLLLKIAHQEINSSEKIYLKGKLTDVERFQKLIDTWNLTSESLKDELVSYFKRYDPLNSVYIMAFSGARGNLSQVRQLVGMRGLMSDPSGELLKLPIKKNFREGLTITDYLMSGYGARKGIIDTALKTANSGYLTRRLIDVAQDIIIREKDCLTKHSCLIINFESNLRIKKSVYEKILGRLLNKSIYDEKTKELIAEVNTQVTPNLIRTLKQKQIKHFYVRSPLTCSLYRSICQKCYGWDLANENLIDIGERIGIIAGQSIGEPGTQLTMRTFHTGGIFTSEIRGTIRSPISGIVKFSKRLKRIPIRTNRGEDVLLTKNAGSLIIIPEEKNSKPVKLELFRNTVVFHKNNQYIQKNAIIAELVDDEKQTRTEIKPVLTTTSGEVFIPRIINKLDNINKTKLLWILSGNVYQAPQHSFLNFYNDYKINKNSYIFRTKLINDFSGFTVFTNSKYNLFQRILQLVSNSCWILPNSKIQKLQSSLNKKPYFLNIKKLKYLIDLKLLNSKYFIEISSNKHFGTLVTNNYQTLTGGIGYYDFRCRDRIISDNKTISYFLPWEPKKKSISLEFLTLLESQFLKSFDILSLILKKNPDLEDCRLAFFPNNFNLHSKVETFSHYSKQTNSLNLAWFSIVKQFPYRSVIWMSEENYELNCDKNLLLVEHGNFISKNFEIVPGIVSKTGGIVMISDKNKLTQEITIKTGSVYEGSLFNYFKNKIFYPGEIILDSLKITQPSFCECFEGRFNDQLLIRPLQVYEVPQFKSLIQIFGTKFQTDLPFNLTNNISYRCKSNKIIKESRNFTIIDNILDVNIRTFAKKQFEIELFSDVKKNHLNFLVSEKLSLNHFILPQLRYTDIQSCLLVQTHQFIDSYTILGYLEVMISKSLEIVQFKSKYKDSKQICLISNEDCRTIPKNSVKNKTIDNLLINNANVNYTGKILMDNDEFVTIQKGRPYFFPNCKNEEAIINTDLIYKPLQSSSFLDNSKLKTNRLVYLNYFDITKGLINQRIHSQDIICKFSKMFIKKNGKLYSSLLAGLINRIAIINKQLDSQQIPSCPTSIRKYREENSSKKLKKRMKRKYKKITGIKTLLFIKNSELNLNPLKDTQDRKNSLTVATFMLSKFYKFTGGIHSITEDYFDEEVNSVFCKNGEFVKNGQTIGLLNFEKEITGDIVQGLPRVEQLLEARKKKQITKNLPINKKKGLLTQTTSIDSYFEFKKLGTSIKENEKINPHNLLKVYFNYYGLIKTFFCENSYTKDSYRLFNNYEASYRSFKKVQSLILNSVQSVYKSQGVSIADKHLEVIIKQMTTKVLITHQGNTSLLPREVIDLYHIEYINKIARIHKKHPALYVPLLLGITKAALNNPSFISAASFQETTRVLTKAAIEGRVDWLRGLKENIIIGHLMPAGTGSPVYTNCFKKSFENNLN